MRPTLWVLTGLALLLGLAHLALWVFAGQDWSLNGLWFVGSGLAVLSAALINIAMLRARAVDQIQKAVWALVNLLTAAFFGLAWTVLKEPQVVVGSIVFALLCLAAARSKSTDLVRRNVP